MSATPPSGLVGTQAPSAVELLWDRYRSLFYVIVAAVLLAMAGSYFYGRHQQGKVDERWSSLATGVGLHKLYDAKLTRLSSFPEVLKDVSSEQLDATLGAASPAQKPFVMMAIARKAMMAKNWDRAEAMLKDLEANYPNHSLVAASEHPVQTQEPIVKSDEEEPKPGERKKPELKPVAKGSIISLMREQIAAGRSYQAPGQFAATELSKDGQKIKFELSEGYGHFVLQLLPDRAPLHVKAFLENATRGSGRAWRSTRSIAQPSPSSRRASSTLAFSRRRKTTARSGT
jgi:hypothetical protein